MWESLEGFTRTVKAVARCEVCKVIQSEAIPLNSETETGLSFFISNAPSGLRHQLPAYSRTER